MNTAALVACVGPRRVCRCTGETPGALVVYSVDDERRRTDHNIYKITKTTKTFLMW